MEVIFTERELQVLEHLVTNLINVDRSSENVIILTKIQQLKKSEVSEE